MRNNEFCNHGSETFMVHNQVIIRSLGYKVRTVRKRLKVGSLESLNSSKAKAADDDTFLHQFKLALVKENPGPTQEIGCKQGFQYTPRNVESLEYS